MTTEELLLMGLLGAGARLLDVPLGVLKTTFIVSGRRGFASVAAFFEVLIYTLAASSIFKNTDKPLVLILFCLGYSAGMFLGITLEKKLAFGYIQIDIITDKNNWEFPDYLRNKGYAVTSLKGWGMDGAEKAYSTMIISRKKLNQLQKIIKEKEMSSFITIKPVNTSFGGTYNPHV